MFEVQQLRYNKFHTERGNLKTKKRNSSTRFVRPLRFTSNLIQEKTFKGKYAKIKMNLMRTK